MNFVFLGWNFLINLREKGFKIKMKYKKMKVNWLFYFVKFMRYKDVNVMIKVFYFDVFFIVVSKVEVVNLWVML